MNESYLGIIIMRQKRVNHRQEEPEGIFFLHEQQHHPRHEIEGLAISDIGPLNRDRAKEAAQAGTAFARAEVFMVGEGSDKQKTYN